MNNTTYRAKTSALNVLPMMLPSDTISQATKWETASVSHRVPRCGTLLQYGRADVISIFRSPGTGRLHQQCQRLYWIA
jgi:hypothetical protein